MWKIGGKRDNILENSRGHNKDDGKRAGNTEENSGKYVIMKGKLNGGWLWISEQRTSLGKWSAKRVVGSEDSEGKKKIVLKWNSKENLNIGSNEG